MEDFFRIVVVELVLKYGPGVLPWLVVLFQTGTFYTILRWLIRERLEDRAVLIELLREGHESDKAQAVESRRLADIVQSARPRR